MPASLPVCDHYAGSEKIMRKSMEIQNALGACFDITFDCEDGASAGNEFAHAQLVADLLNDRQNQFNRIGARVHDVESEHFKNDVAIICQQAAAKLAYIMLPKANSVADVEKALLEINRNCDPATTPLPLHVLIETHGALVDVWKIAALPQVQSLSFGIMDFVSEHYGAIPATAMRSPGQFTHPLVVRAKLEIAAACHAFGKVPSHNVTTDIQNSALITTDAQQAMGLGYTRMWSIHPSQIEPIVRTMTPSLEEINEASDILCAAQLNQWGPIQHLGRLHDRASYRYYWSLLQRAHTLGRPLSAASLQLVSLGSEPHL
jgi:citrate lyase subunit beta/citryl-CoA lyase